MKVTLPDQYDGRVFRNVGTTKVVIKKDLILPSDPTTDTEAVNKRYIDLKVSQLQATYSVNVDNARVAALNGPALLYSGGVFEFTITDYDSKSNYSVTVDQGSASINGDKITFNAPSSATTVNMTVTRNGIDRPIVFEVKDSVVETPSITSPTANEQNVSLSPLVTASAFSYLGQPISHTASQWQIATDLGFTSIVEDSGTDTVNLTSWQPSTVLTDGQTYYVRVRYQGSNNEWSLWSAPVSFVTIDIKPVKLLNIDPNLELRAIKAVTFDEGYGIEHYVLFANNNPSYQCILVKTTEDGVLRWAKELTGFSTTDVLSIDMTVGSEDGEAYLYITNNTQVIKVYGYDGSSSAGTTNSVNMLYPKIAVAPKADYPYMYITYMENTGSANNLCLLSFDDFAGFLSHKTLMTGTDNQIRSLNNVSNNENGTDYLYVSCIDWSTSYPNHRLNLIKLDTNINSVFYKSLTLTNAYIEVARIDAGVINNSPVVYAALRADSDIFIVKVDAATGDAIASVTFPISNTFMGDVLLDCKIVEHDKGTSLYVLLQDNDWSSNTYRGVEWIELDTDLNYLRSYRAKSSDISFIDGRSMFIWNNNGVDHRLNILLQTSTSGDIDGNVIELIPGSDSATGTITIKGRNLVIEQTSKTVTNSTVHTQFVNDTTTITDKTATYTSFSYTETSVLANVNLLTYA